MKAIMEESARFPMFAERDADASRGSTSTPSIFMFLRKWNECYRVLRHSNGFGRFDSVRFGLWLARGCA